jgi:hypothetical protein
MVAVVQWESFEINRLKSKIMHIITNDCQVVSNVYKALHAAIVLLEQFRSLDR